MEATCYTRISGTMGLWAGAHLVRAVSTKPPKHVIDMLQSNAAVDLREVHGELKE